MDGLKKVRLSGCIRTDEHHQRLLRLDLTVCVVPETLEFESLDTHVSYSLSQPDRHQQVGEPFVTRSFEHSWLKRACHFDGDRVTFGD